MNAVKHKELTVYGGKQHRPFIHVKNIGKIIVSNLQTKYSDIYNLTSFNTTILDIAKMIQEETDCRIVIAERKFEDNRSYNAIIKKGLSDGVFGTSTKYTIPYGISEIKELILSGRIKNIDLDLYSNEKFLLEAIRQNEN